MSDQPAQPTVEEFGKLFRTIFDDLVRLKRREHLNAAYANYANFELSDLDLKMLFGQLDQSGPKADVDWHTAVTIAWPEAKIMSYFLRVNLAIHEAHHGVIKVPVAMLPPTLERPEDADSNPTSNKLFDRVQAIRKELMDEQLALWPKTNE
jgi:lysophospholipase L1-like esterase